GRLARVGQQQPGHLLEPVQRQARGARRHGLDVAVAAAQVAAVRQLERHVADALEELRERDRAAAGRGARPRDEGEWTPGGGGRVHGEALQSRPAPTPDHRVRVCASEQNLTGNRVRRRERLAPSLSFAAAGPYGSLKVYERSRPYLPAEGPTCSTSFPPGPAP